MIANLSKKCIVSYEYKPVVRCLHARAYTNAIAFLSGAFESTCTLFTAVLLTFPSATSYLPRRVNALR